MSSHVSHVTELKSNANGNTISFQMSSAGNPVNTGRFKIKDLQGGRVVNVDVHDVTDWLEKIPGLEIRVLVNRRPILVLYPIYLVMFLRITFDCCFAGGITTLSVKGLLEQEKDGLLRLRFRKGKRQTEYRKRENVPELVMFIGEGKLTTEESDVRSVTPYGLPQMIGDELPSHGRIDHITAAPSLAYEEPLVVEGTGNVAVIPDSAINKDVVDMMKHALVGFSCVTEILECAPIRDYLSETLSVFRDCKVLSHDNGFFSFVFSSEEDRSKVLEHGQLFIKSKPLILKKWTRDLTREPCRFLYSFPVWVRIYDMNFAYWSTRSLSIVSSKIGSLLFLDKVTTSIIEDPGSIFNCASTSTQHFDFARVYIEINPLNVLPDVVPVLMNGKLISVRVEYEYKPQLCTHCCLLYHEAPEQNQGNTRRLSHSPNGSVSGLTTEDDEDGESTCGSTAFSSSIDSWR